MRCLLTLKNTVATLAILTLASQTFAQRPIEVTDLPEKPRSEKTSDEAVARKYMKPVPRDEGEDESSGPARRRSSSSGDASHSLMTGIQIFGSSTAYRWLNDKDEDVEKWTIGIDYRFGEWVNSTDLSLKVDVTRYGLGEESAFLISFIPTVTFPDSRSLFPVYFGGGVGPGIFVKQLARKSPISAGYKLFAGARFFNIGDSNVGAFLEAGLKGHFFLLSEGQVNGVYVTTGAIFTF